MTHAVLVTGAGGVGKTTLSAALAVAAARNGIRSLVVTVDPARRLADALGLAGLGAEPTPHPHQPDLWAAMIDAKGSWAAVAHDYADPAVADRLIANRFFAAASSHFPASQAFAAADEAVRLIEARAWELVVVDTPPASGGIEFFTAPGALTDLVGGRLLRWITGGRMPGRRFIFDRTARPALRILDQVLGASLLEGVAEFLMDLRTTYDGVSRRSKEIERVVSRATGLVITTPDPTPIREAIRFFRELPEIAATPTAVVFNRTLPPEWIEARPGRVRLELAENLSRWSRESQRQHELITEFSERYQTQLVTIPWQPDAPTDLDSLAELIAVSTGSTLKTLVGA